MQNGNKRIAVKYQIPYSEIFLFEIKLDISSSNKRNYKAFITVSLNSNNMQLFNRVFDSVTGPSLMREAILWAEWQEALEMSDRPSLTTASN